MIVAPLFGVRWKAVSAASNPADAGRRNYSIRTFPGHRCLFWFGVPLRAYGIRPRLRQWERSLRVSAAVNQGRGPGKEKRRPIHGRGNWGKVFR
jgi:hypothetical protein